VVAAGAVTGIALASAGGGGASPPASAGSSPSADGAAPASIPITASSGLAPLTGDVYVEYQRAGDETAQITGEVSNATSGEVARLYAQQFPYTSAPAPAGSVGFNGNGPTASYAFQVTPNLATRYQVKLFKASTATTPLAISATTTIYVGLYSPTTDDQNCNGSTCTVTLTWTETVPPSALNTEIAKQVYVYFAVNFSSTDPAPRPISVQLGVDDPTVTIPQRLSADEFEDSATFTFQNTSNDYHWAFDNCTKDTESEDGIGLPGSHGCGTSQLPFPIGYAG
jgi:hypothetical protein